MNDVVIALLVVALAFVSYRLAAVENQRYALELNMCPSPHGLLLPDLKCLKTVQTRTSWVWNLYYGLSG